MPLSTHRSPATTGTLPPVLLVHGFASNAAADYVDTGWLAALHAAGRTAVAIDLPGHGDSPSVESPEHATTSAVVAAILDAAEASFPEGKFDVIGYSLGGRLSWELPTASPRIRRLVLGGVSPFEPFAAIAPGEIETALAGGDSGNPLAQMMAGMISSPGRDTASLSRLIAGLASEPFQPETGGPAVPTLLVAGDDDPLTGGIESLATAIPNGSLVRVPGDHRGALDSAEFRAAAIAFLTE